LVPVTIIAPDLNAEEPIAEQPKEKARRNDYFSLDFSVKHPLPIFIPLL